MMDEDVPAQKRRRLMPESPAGFETRRPVERLKASKLQVPTIELVSELRRVFPNPQPSQKAPSKSKFDGVSPFVPKPISKSKQSPPAHILTSKNLNHNAIPSFILPSREKGKAKDTSTYRVLPPPDPPLPFKDGKLPTPRVYPLPPPPPPNFAPEKPISSLKALPLPPPPLVLQTPTEATPDKSMRTISTTEIALATDLFTENGTAELAHIFLQDQHPDIAYRRNNDTAKWNIGLSPRKERKYIGGKGEEANFLRNGLALRASEVKKRWNTDLALWHKEIENNLSLSSSSVGVTPDLRLRIIKIMDWPAGMRSSSPRKPTTSTSTVLSPGLAICRVLCPPSNKGSKLMRVFFGSKKEQVHLVVLSFLAMAPARIQGSNRQYARNPEDFVVGREVYVWEPWQEVVLPSQELPVDDAWSLTGNGDPEVTRLAPAPFPLLPPTFHRSPEHSRLATQDLTSVSEIALLCSRFVISL